EVLVTAVGAQDLVVAGAGVGPLAAGLVGLGPFVEGDKAIWKGGTQRGNGQADQGDERHPPEPDAACIHKPPPPEGGPMSVRGGNVREWASSPQFPPSIKGRPNPVKHTWPRGYKRHGGPRASRSTGKPGAAIFFHRGAASTSPIF